MKAKAHHFEEEFAALLKDVEGLADRLAFALGSARNRAGEMEKPLRQHLEAAEEAVGERVQKRPLASLLAAFVAGFTLSAFLLR